MSSNSSSGVLLVDVLDRIESNMRTNLLHVCNISLHTEYLRLRLDRPGRRDLFPDDLRLP